MDKKIDEPPESTLGKDQHHNSNNNNATYLKHILATSVIHVVMVR